MMSKKILMVFVSMIFLALALAPTVQAFTSEVAYSSGQSNGMKTVTEGDVVGIQVTSIGIGEKLKSQVLEIEGGPNSIDKQLFSDNSQGRKEGFVREYGRTYQLDTSNYQPGTYTIKFTSEGQQSSPKTSSIKLVIEKNQPPQDNNAPNLNISYPDQGVIYNSQVTELRYTPTDPEGNLDKCWYSTDSGQTNSSKVNCNGRIQNTFSGLSSNQGQNTWTVWASDTSGNVAKESVNFTFNKKPKDSNAPNVNILFPQNTSYQSITKSEYTAKDPEDNLNRCWYSLNGGPQIFVNCQESVLNDFNINPGVGTHTLKVYAQDDAGNVGSDTVTFTITGTGGGDNKAPNITPINPKDGEKLKDNKLKYINVSTNEKATVKYNLQGVTTSNITMTNPSGNIYESPILHSLTYGKTYQITYYATDSAGNTGEKTITFEIKNKSQKPGPGSGSNKSGKSSGGSKGSSGGDDFTPGQGGYYNHEKDEYLDQFDEPQSTRIIESSSGDDKSFFDGINLSKWILPVLASLIGLTMIALAAVLGMRQSEIKVQKNSQNFQNQWTKPTEQPRSQYDQGPYWY